MNLSELGCQPFFSQTLDELAEPVAASPTRSIGYIRELERDLRRLLDAGDTEAVARWVKTKCIESFRNGVEQGQASTA